MVSTAVSTQSPTRSDAITSSLHTPVHTVSRIKGRPTSWQYIH